MTKTSDTPFPAEEGGRADWICASCVGEGCEACKGSGFNHEGDPVVGDAKEALAAIPSQESTKEAIG